MSQVRAKPGSAETLPCPDGKPLPVLVLGPALSKEGEGEAGRKGEGPGRRLTSPCSRDLVSLGISSAEHREALLSGISALQARVLQLQGQGVQV